jgi:uncharacterized protein YecT (DUF1311 family)
MSDASTASAFFKSAPRMACCLPDQMAANPPLGENMKVLSRLSIVFCLASLVAAAACRKETKANEVANAGQDTMLMHDLAEANRNTAAAAAMDNSLNTNGATVTPGTAQNPSDARVTPAGSPSGGEILTSGPKMSPPTKANDAPAPTTVPLARSPAAGGLVRANRDPCNSTAAVDQRSCLNRSIVSNDADLNRTYQELIDQAQKSGGAELQDRFQQSQREWINKRDSDCTAQTPSENGKLWAKARAGCLADHSAKRTAELQRNLNNLRGQ